MWRTSVYFISILLLTLHPKVSGQDSIKVPLSIRAGIDAFGPAYYFTNKNNLSIEGFAAFDYDLKKSFVAEAGFQNFSYSQYNYDYGSVGAFLRLGVDFNSIKPFQAAGKYYAGVGLRYGISLYKMDVPQFTHENYWGKALGSVPSSTHLAHFIEFDPGVRTQIFKNVSIGWNLRLKLMIYRGIGKDMKPVSIPGFGNSVKSFSPGINYYIIFSIPYKSVFARPEAEKVSDTDADQKDKSKLE
jgi:hypothetical protein